MDIIQPESLDFWTCLQSDLFAHVVSSGGLVAMAVLTIYVASHKKHNLTVLSTGDVLDLGNNVVSGFTTVLLPVLATLVLVSLYWASPETRAKIARHLLKPLAVTGLVSTMLSVTHVAQLIASLFNRKFPNYIISTTQLSPGYVEEVDWKEAQIKDPAHFGRYLRSQNIEFVKPQHKFTENDTASAVVFSGASVLGVAVAFFVAYGYFDSYSNKSSFMYLPSSFYSNVMGVSSAVNMLLNVQLGSTKSLALLLGIFFIYDIYFVFGSDVMETVAMTVDIPAKLVLPNVGGGSSILGLGDVVVPGLYMLFCERFKRSYFRVSLAAYICSMVCCFTALIRYNLAQPALLYIVPFCLSLTFAYALWSREFKQFWNFSVEIAPYDENFAYPDTGDRESESDSDYELDSYDEWEFKVEDLRDQATDIDTDASEVEDLYNFIEDDDDQTFIIETNEIEEVDSDIELDSEDDLQIDKDEVRKLIDDSEKSVSYWFD